MRLTPGLLRLKLALADHGRQVLLSLLVVAAAALFGAGLALADAPTETVTTDRHEQTVATDLSTSAVVTGDSDLYEQGRRLKGMPVYLRSATPNLTVRLRTATPDGTETRVDQRLWLAYTVSRNGGTIWQQRQRLAAADTDVEDGATTVDTDVRIAAVAGRLAELREEVGGAAEVSVRLHALVEYDTGRYRGNLSASAPVRIGEQAYWLDGDVAASRAHATPVREQRVDRSRAVALPLPVVGRVFASHLAVVLAAVGLASLGGAAWVRTVLRRGVDEVACRNRLHELRYEEWISEGRIPSDVGERRIRMDSLQALVDVAIDSSKRVVYDADRDSYVVVDGEVVYYYHALSDPALGPFNPKVPVEE